MGSKVNRKAVRRAIRSGEVTGSNVRRLTLSILAELRAHPCHYGKVFDMLEGMIGSGEIQIHDAVPRFSDLEKRETLRVRKFRAKKRSKMCRRQTQPFAQKASMVPEQAWSPAAIPIEWIGCNPDDYRSRYGWGGVKSREAGEITRRANEAARQRAIHQAMLEQFEDWLCDGMTPELGHEDDVRSGLGFSIPA